MTLTKVHIVESIFDAFKDDGYNRKDCLEMVETLLEIMKQSLESGEDVMISGFGKFCIKEKNQRRGRNPATGETMLLPARRVVTFKCSGKLRGKLNPAHAAANNRAN